MILVSQSYDAGSEERNRELLLCQKANEKSDVFEKVEYLDGRQRRLSFTDLVAYCEKRHRGQWCVIANSDIVFPSSSRAITLFKRDGLIVSLTRWETITSPRFVGHFHADRLFSGSQDSWAFLAGGIPCPSNDIPLGVVGCDQVIAGWAVQSGIEIVNPSLSIRTTHVHATPLAVDDRPSMAGFFGYPEMTSLSTTGDVLCHHWPDMSGEWRYEWQLLATKK